MIWEKKNFSIENDITILNQWEKDHIHQWAGVLLCIKHGKGALKVSFHDSIEEGFLTLTLHEKPLFQVHGDNYFCPTCEKIIRSGYALEQDEIFTIDGINDAKAKVSLSDAVNNLKPLWGLLPSGYYIIHDMQLYPTDGNGHLFWNYPNTDKAVPGSCSAYLGEFHYADEYPLFTIATQSRALCNEERVSYYQKHDDARAIAYYTEGYLCALLDGHHKMLAAARNQTTCNALVIEACKLCHQSDKYYLYSSILNADNEKAFLINKEEYQKIEKTMSQKSINRIPMYNEFFMMDEVVADIICDISMYPSLEEAVARLELGSKFEQMASNALAGKLTEEDDDLFIFIKALITMEDKQECRKIFMKLCQPSNTKDVVYESIRGLVKLPKDDELEELLISLYNTYDHDIYIKSLIADHL